MKKLLLFVLLLPVLNFKPTFAQIIPISDLHQNDVDGVPQLLNQTVTVKGEVTVTDQFGIIASIEDEAGGITIYDSNFASAVNIGDSVVVSGDVTQYNGLTELKSITIIEHHIRTRSLIPQVITCNDIANEGKNGIENFEGELVRINNVTVNTGTWTVSSSGTNFILGDATGSCEIRIDKDTNIANTDAPSDTFDVIGVVAQYDPSSPYTSGYQLMPRFREDIISSSLTQVVEGPIEKNITPYSMDISWVTQSPANSILIYGKTTDYEMDTIVVDEAVIAHQVQLTGLWPATVYHLRAGSGESENMSFSPDHVVITASPPTSTGTMHVYFSQSVDPSYARYQRVAQQVNIFSKFASRVNSAYHSIDLCVYSITLDEVAEVLIGASNRGVSVRVIYNYEPSEPYDTNAITMLKNAGIPVINDRFGDNSGSKAMHNKFMVIDCRDTTSARDDWVWTGSYNLTFSASSLNAENVIEIQDQSLAKSYTIEFNEMWGSDTDVPNASLSKFSTRKINNTPHIFNINGIELVQFMSPSDKGLPYLLKEIGQAQSSLYFCMLIFTNYEIVDNPKIFQIKKMIYLP